ncbi:GLPGLI family protein [Elizabethkingia anophelis]|uniref:GLPGLI family protein n=1 Tax=Elizabethkingia anophelis TaxID=1117645 RepID=UPI00038A327E|nr:GLPGLI family protein [Elizabethkingia anophelis]EQB92813.1 hypothetical protein C874_18020 [Elizabethkingia anophelis 502]
MKKIQLLIFLFLSLSPFFSQKIDFKSNIQIFYSLDFKPDSTQTKKINDVVCLYIGEKQSIYQDERKSKVDSIIAKQRVTLLPPKPMFRVNHVIFKDLKKSELTYSEIIDNAVFGYTEPFSNMKWKITNEKKKILNHECIKAETKFRGRNYIAWFTKDIPISDGPYKFAGLPGLILEVYDDKDSFHYQLLAIEKKPKNILYETNIHFIDRKKLIDSKINNIIKNSKTEVKINPMEKN